MNSLAMFQALIFEPRRAFAEMAERPRFAFPLLALMLGGAGIVLWYYNVVDMEWMVDRQLRTSSFGSRLTEAQIEEAVERSTANPGVRSVMAVLATMFSVVLLNLLYALYLLLAGKITNVQRRFGQWFALSCWTSMPTVVGYLSSAMVLFTATTAQIDQAALQPLSLNALFFHLAPEQSGFALLSAVNLFQLFGAWLLVQGVRVWSGRSWLFSTIFALLPLALILGVVAMFMMGRS